MSEVEPRLGFRVVRLEVASEPMKENDLTWRAWASDDDEEATVVLGYLRSTSSTGFGQARVAAVLTGMSYSTDRGLDEWMKKYILEHLYDTARRAINSQAAAMDLSLELPTKAPTIEIDRLPRS